MTTPGQAYASRLAAREVSLARYDRLDLRLGNLRLALAAALLVLAWACIGRGLNPAWLLLPAVLFAAAVSWHRRLRQRRALAQHAVHFYRQGIERLDDAPRATDGSTGERFRDEHHLYSDDLDLFGEHGLFPRLCVARTPMGENTLAAWLLAPAAIAVIAQRHAAVAELRDRLELREDLAVAGEPGRIGLRPEELLRWGGGADDMPRGLRGLAVLLTSAAVATAGVWAVAGISFPFLAVFVAAALLDQTLKRRVQTAVAGVEDAYQALSALTALMRRVETEPFVAEPLRSLQRSLDSGDGSASQRLAQLATIVNFVEARRNPLLAPLRVAFLYTVHAALSAETWRRRHGHVMAEWLRVLGELEALQSFARRSFERPDEVFPEFSSAAAAEFVTVQVGHPLLPEAACVRNDVALHGATRLLMVSGSNMAGKSTLLRAVGLNAVLAMAGGTVRAASLRLSPCQVGASIRVNDSLFEGSSRFYAEITRLRQLFAASGTPNAGLPLLFLLDELLQGTNSADRLVGATGVIGALLERGAIGLVSTHDLALAVAPQRWGGSLKNVHLQDELEGGTLRFDFKLRDGIVTKSNALELMRAIGLEV